jgi:hypothetical protein
MGGERHGAQRPIQAPHEFRLCRVVSVVCGLDSHVMPEGFDGVELRAVPGQCTQVEAMAVVPQPLPHLGRPMVRGVIVDQEDLLPRVAVRQAVQKGRVAPAFEDLAMPVVEFRPAQIDGPENLLRVALARRRDQGLVSSARPCLVQAGVLPETGFIGEEQGGVAIRGFFLTAGRCSAASGPAPPDRPSPTGVVGAGPKSPSP